MKPKENFGIAEPAKCTRMSEEETEYDGGFFHLSISLALSAVSVGCDFAVSTGWVKGKWAKRMNAVSYACTVGAAITSFGGTTALACESKTVAKHLIGKRTTDIAKGAGQSLTSMFAVPYETGVIASGSHDYGIGGATGIAISRLLF
ncbi:hypothetical protein PAA26_04070 [Methanomassiliicoccaceae archaeon COG_1]|nr:hypothetical protein [Methanomassiliicoccaceae archaeon COG_1]